LVAVVGGFSAGRVPGAELQGSTPAEGAKAVLTTYCYRCHGKDGRNEGGLNVVTDLQKLVESKRVVPGEPDRSKLLKRVQSGEMPPEIDLEDQAENPPALPRPGPKEITLLRDWIKAGAPVSAPKTAGRKFLADADFLRLIQDDLKRIGPRERRFTRYFLLTNLANAGYNEDQLQTYRHGLSKLINSLSWHRRIKVPTAADPDRVVLRIDLRDYLWDEGVWQAILDHYPYGLRYDGAVAASITEMTACDLPLVRADWFVDAASRPPLYHAVLRLPETVADLERKLDVDVAANIRQDRVVRAAFNASGVSRNNRLIERHESTNGGYWRSYDFAANADRKNLFARPLGPGDGRYEFQHDGGEIVFALPNGLNGYMLTDAEGNRIDKGPTEIVRDNKQADGAVVNGISCMSCHNRGLIEKADQVRDVVAKSKAFDKEAVETIMALYPPRERFEELMKGDLDRFAGAVKETGAALSHTEPVFALAVQFEEELNAALAAAESGLLIKDFQDLLSRSAPLGQALGPLLAEGTVKRDVFVAAFPLIAEARHLTVLAPKATRLVLDTKPAASQSQAGMPQGGRFPSPSRGQRPSLNARPNSNSSTGPAPKTAPAGKTKGYDPDRLANLPPSFFGGDRDRFRDVGPAGSVLVGVRISTHLFFGGPKISSTVPIYRSGSRLIEGATYGQVTGPETTAVARPGYAVGGLKTRTGLSVDGFGMVFMRIKDGRLDPSDSYDSPWLGDTQGGSPGTVYSDGSLPVGLQGRAEKNVNALGLVVVK
jgi:hypothetical protein